MSWLDSAATVIGIVGLVYWALNAAGAVKLRGLPVLAEVPVSARERWPKLSLVIPARDEAKEIEAAVRSRLSDGYPDLEVVLVDDRSTDGTSDIIDRLAAEDPRVVAVHVRELPSGWLGKLNALEQGLRRASGEWILFTDADTHVAPGALQRAVAYAQEHGADHFCVLPELWRTQPLLDIGVATMMRLILVAARVWKVADPTSRAYCGVGAFNLVRRAALEKTPGLEWLKLEIGDDVGLGLMMKRHGFRSHIALGRGAVALRFFDSFGAMARSAEKGAAVFRCKLWVAALASAAFALLELSYLWALASSHALPLALGAASAGLALLAGMRVNRAMGLPAWTAWPAPVGSALFVALMFRAALLASMRGGVTWRGTLYSSAELAAGRRVNFP